jgi:hypothetical protein
MNNKDIEKKNLNKNNEIICDICLKNFSRKDSLERHKMKICKKKNNNENIINIVNNENIVNNDNTIKNENIVNNDNTIKNENITINQQNIFIINNKDVNIKPFDEEWNVEHINTYFVKHLLLSNEKFTDLLLEILKNDENLNVIVDKSSETGLVYKNNVDMYVEMKKNEIIDQSMYKLNIQIEKYYNDFFSKIFDNNLSTIKKHIINALNIEKDITNSKYINYINDKKINKNVSDVLSNIFQNRKDEAVIIGNNLLNTTNDGY